MYSSDVLKPLAFSDHSYEVVVDVDSLAIEAENKRQEAPSPPQWLSRILLTSTTVPEKVETFLSKLSQLFLDQTPKAQVLEFIHFDPLFEVLLPEEKIRAEHWIVDHLPLKRRKHAFDTLSNLQKEIDIYRQGYGKYVTSPLIFRNYERKAMVASLRKVLQESFTNPLRTFSQRTAIDIGSWDGRLIEQTSRNLVPNVTAVEPDIERFGSLLARTSQEGFHAVHASMENILDSPSKYPWKADFILMSHVLYFLTGEKRDFESLDWAYNTLYPGGTALVVLNNVALSPSSRPHFRSFMGANETNPNTELYVEYLEKKAISYAIHKPRVIYQVTTPLGKAFLKDIMTYTIPRGDLRARSDKIDAYLDQFVTPRGYFEHSLVLIEIRKPFSTYTPSDHDIHRVLTQIDLHNQRISRQKGDYSQMISLSAELFSQDTSLKTSKLIEKLIGVSMTGAELYALFGHKWTYLLSRAKVSSLSLDTQSQETLHLEKVSGIKRQVLSIFEELIPNLQADEIKTALETSLTMSSPQILSSLNHLESRRGEISIENQNEYQHYVKWVGKIFLGLRELGYGIEDSDLPPLIGYVVSQILGEEEVIEFDKSPSRGLDDNVSSGIGWNENDSSMREHYNFIRELLPTLHFAGEKEGWNVIAGPTQSGVIDLLVPILLQFNWKSRVSFRAVLRRSGNVEFTPAQIQTILGWVDEAVKQFVTTHYSGLDGLFDFSQKFARGLSHSGWMKVSHYVDPDYLRSMGWYSTREGLDVASYISLRTEYAAGKAAFVKKYRGPGGFERLCSQHGFGSNTLVARWAIRKIVSQDDFVALSHFKNPAHASFRIAISDEQGKIARHYKGREGLSRLALRMAMEKLSKRPEFSRVEEMRIPEDKKLLHETQIKMKRRIFQVVSKKEQEELGWKDMNPDLSAEELMRRFSGFEGQIRYCNYFGISMRNAKRWAMKRLTPEQGEALGWRVFYGRVTGASHLRRSLFVSGKPVPKYTGLQGRFRFGVDYAGGHIAAAVVDSRAALLPKDLKALRWKVPQRPTLAMLSEWGAPHINLEQAATTNTNAHELLTFKKRVLDEKGQPKPFYQGKEGHARYAHLFLWGSHQSARSLAKVAFDPQTFLSMNWDAPHKDNIATELYFQGLCPVVDDQGKIDSYYQGGVGLLNYINYCGLPHAKGVMERVRTFVSDSEWRELGWEKFQSKLRFYEKSAEVTTTALEDIWKPYSDAQRKVMVAALGFYLEYERMPEGPEWKPLGFARPSQVYGTSEYGPKNALRHNAIFKSPSAFFLALKHTGRDLGINVRIVFAKYLGPDPVSPEVRHTWRKEAAELYFLEKAHHQAPSLNRSRIMGSGNYRKGYPLYERQIFATKAQARKFYQEHASDFEIEPLTPPAQAPLDPDLEAALDTQSGKVSFRYQKQDGFLRLAKRRALEMLRQEDRSFPLSFDFYTSPHQDLLIEKMNMVQRRIWTKVRPELRKKAGWHGPEKLKKEAFFELTPLNPHLTITETYQSERGFVEYLKATGLRASEALLVAQQTLSPSDYEALGWRSVETQIGRGVGLSPPWLTWSQAQQEVAFYLFSEVLFHGKLPFGKHLDAQTSYHTKQIFGLAQYAPEGKNRSSAVFENPSSVILAVRSLCLFHGVEFYSFDSLINGKPTPQLQAAWQEDALKLLLRVEKGLSDRRLASRRLYGLGEYAEGRKNHHRAIFPNKEVFQKAWDEYRRHDTIFFRSKCNEELVTVAN